MKTIRKRNRKNNFSKTVKILMVILIAFGIFQLPGQSINLDNVVHAAGEEQAKAVNDPFDNVSITEGSKIFLGGQPATYVGNKTLLSDKTSGKVAGDTAGIEAGSNAVWNSYYSKDRANAMGVLSMNGLPSIAEINLWKNNISIVDGNYWLSDDSTKKISQYGYTDSSAKVPITVDVPMKAYASGQNTLPENKKTISGEHKNGAWFDSKEFNFGSYAYNGSSSIDFKEREQPEGYWYDPLGTSNFKTNRRMFYRIFDTLGEKEYIDNFPNESPRVYTSPECKPEDEMIFEVERYGFAPWNANAIVYDPAKDVYRVPADGETVKAGEILAFLYYEEEKYRLAPPDYSKPSGSFLKTKFKNEQDRKKIERTLEGNIPLGPIMQDFRYEVGTPSYNTTAYFLYSKAPCDIRVMTNQLDLNTDRINFTGGMWYNPTERTIPASSIEAATNTVRPKMTLDTSKIKFARDSSHSNTPASSTLGAMPTTTLQKGSNYKLVLENEALGVSKIAKGARITAIGGTAPSGSVKQDNVITVSPGTTEITIPVYAKGGDKISAVTTKKDGSKAYGIVGSVSDKTMTINIADLMDTSKVTNKIDQGKTITLYDEILNSAKNSDEISTNGLTITVKVENPQTIDFTQTTKDLLVDKTYSDKDTFEVSAKVTDKGIESLADIKTPIAFTADSSYLVQVGTTKWDESSLTATATFKVVQSQKSSISDDKYKITINRAGTDTNNPAPQVTSTKVQTEMLTYTISYNLNAPPGEDQTNISDNNKKMTYTVEDIVTINPLSLTGYTFTGWSERVTKGLDGADKDIVLPDEAGTVNDVDKTITINEGSIGHRKYTANWVINKYNITIDPNGGTYQGFTTNTIITGVNYKDTRTILDPTPPNKKVFTGWKLIGNLPLGGGFGIGDEKNIYTMGAGDITIQAQYKDMNQSIQFTAETESKLKDNTYAYGEEFEVEAEAIEVDGHLPDKTKGIEFSTQDTEYLEIVGEPTWNPSTFKAKATFKVVKPLPEGDTNTLTIEINKPETDTHNAAQQVSSTNVKTEKRKIDLKIDSNIFVANKGEHRISLKAGEVMPDITNSLKIYKIGGITEDLIAIEDQKNKKIPYIVKTSHWLGNYTGLNGMNKDDVLIEGGKVSQKIAGNIWKLNIVEDTNSKEITWFEERYEVAKKGPTDAIVDVYDITGNESMTHQEILYVNNISMSLDEYKNKIDSVSNKKQVIIDESKFKLTNATSPYKEIEINTQSEENVIRVLKGDSHAGEYEVLFSLENGSGIRSGLTVADAITKNILADEELRANTYIHQKGETLLSDGAQGFLTLMKTEVIDLKTGKKKENMKFDITIANPDVWKKLGETTVSLKTDAGTEVVSKVIVRDNVKNTRNIRVSANNLALSIDEATALVSELNGKSIVEQVSILTPTDPKSKYGMYPYATNYVTGNRVLISSITGLPDISTSTGKVEAGAYDVTFETAGGGTVTAQIKVRTADPTAYVEIPAKIKLKKSNESNVVAEETEEVKLKTGMGVELDALKETILVETPSSFVLKGISPSNTTTELNVDVYTHGKNGETKHDGIVPFATLDSKNTTREYTLRIAKTLPKHRKDLYIGKMDFAISFGKAVSEGGG